MPAATTPDQFIEMARQVITGAGADPGYAMYYLEALFGNWISGGNEYTLITSTFVVINFLAFVFGVIIYFAAIAGGIFKVAALGEVMGQNWGAGLLPMKFVFGVTMLMPIYVSGNVSGSQQLGMTLLQMGSMAGDYTWRLALDNAKVSASRSQPDPMLSMIPKSVLQSAVCASTLAKSQGIESIPLVKMSHSKKKFPRTQKREGAAVWSDSRSSRHISVSYTHLTLPTKRIV